MLSFKSLPEFENYLALHKARGYQVNLYYELTVTAITKSQPDLKPQTVQTPDKISNWFCTDKVSLDWPKIKTYITIGIILPTD